MTISQETSTHSIIWLSIEPRWWEVCIGSEEWNESVTEQNIQKVAAEPLLTGELEEEADVKHSGKVSSRALWHLSVYILHV